MTKFYGAKIQLADAKSDKERRFRNILANSGEIMESGEIRDITNLYVMDYDGRLIRVSDLNTNPEKQAEKYAVKAQADHGELKDGELTPSIEKQFGGCKVWLEDDGLHARMYFAEGDKLADHAWSISEFASYSTGIDWFPDGYYGAGYEIEEPIGILREISMVLTGNDPRAKTIDTKISKGLRGAAVGDNKLKYKGESNMNKKLDALTPDEREALIAKIVDEIDDFTTNAPESETQPTARDTKDEAEEAPKETTDAPAENKETKDAYTITKSRPGVIVIRDRKEVAHQERSVSTCDAYLKTERAVEAWARALMDAKGNAHAWRDSFRKIAKQDGVDFGTNVSLAPELVVNAIAEQLHDEDSLFSHAFKTGLEYEIVAIPTSEQGGVGHVNGQKKTEENIKGASRVITPADIYKLMKLDHSMVKVNGGIGSSAIVKYVLRELPRKLLETIDKAMFVGGIKNDDAEGSAEATDFSALVSIMSDIETANSIYATTYTAQAGDNIRATISKAAGKVLSSSNRTLITTPDFFTDLENSVVTAGSGSLLFPNGINKGEPNINGIRRVITPLWLTKEMLGDYEAVIADLSAYHIVGDTNPENFTDYDIDYNKYVWEVVACVGGALANANAAVGIKPATTPAASKTAASK